jgi:hypothetical protein
MNFLLCVIIYFCLYVIFMLVFKGNYLLPPMNYNVLPLSPHELLTMLLYPYELLFCAKKPIPSVKAVNLNYQSNNTL